MRWKRRTHGEQVRALLRLWERVEKDSDVEKAASRTAAMLSRVHDVPSEIIDSLDKLLSYESEGMGQAIFAVVAYLRRLEEMDRLGLPEIPSAQRSRE